MKILFSHWEGSKLGDCTITTSLIQPLFRELGGEIDVLANTETFPIYENNPYVNKVYTTQHFNRRSRLILSEFKLLNELRENDYDYIFCVNQRLSSHVFAWLIGGKNRVGWIESNLSRLFLTHSITYPTPSQRTEHEAITYTSLLKPFFDPKNSPSRVYSKNKKRHDYVGIGFGSTMSNKQWRLSRFAELTELIASKTKYRVILFGGFLEKKSSKELMSLIEDKSKVINYLSNNLRSTIEKLSEVKFFVTNDSGLSHLASSLGVPTIVLFGASDPKFFKPWNKKAFVIQCGRKCSSCYLTSMYKDCSKKSECLDTILVEDVWKKLKELMGKRK